MVGVKPFVIWICWMIRSLIVYLIISVIITFMGTYKIDYIGYNFVGTKKKALFLNTDSIVVFSICFGNKYILFNCFSRIFHLIIDSFSSLFISSYLFIVISRSNI